MNNDRLTKVGFTLTYADIFLLNRQGDLQTARNGRGRIKDEFLEETDSDIQAARDNIAIAVRWVADELGKGESNVTKPSEEPIVCLVEIVEQAMRRMNTGTNISYREALTLGSITGIASRVPEVMKLLQERESDECPGQN